jgi:Asp-tRNA(Asn)/Glu-tRNA(Gln) amidotransferase A subunit family amidase
MDLAIAGPLARGARDLALALNAMGGFVAPRDFQA